MSENNSDFVRQMVLIPKKVFDLLRDYGDPNIKKIIETVHIKQLNNFNLPSSSSRINVKYVDGKKREGSVSIREEKKPKKDDVSTTFQMITPSAQVVPSFQVAQTEPAPSDQMSQMPEDVMSQSQSQVLFPSSALDESEQTAVAVQPRSDMDVTEQIIPLPSAVVISTQNEPEPLPITTEMEIDPIEAITNEPSREVLGLIDPAPTVPEYSPYSIQYPITSRFAQPPATIPSHSQSRIKQWFPYSSTNRVPLRRFSQFSSVLPLPSTSPIPALLSPPTSTLSTLPPSSMISALADQPTITFSPYIPASLPQPVPQPSLSFSSTPAQPSLTFSPSPMSAITTSTRPSLDYIPPNTSTFTELKNKIKKRIGELKQSRRNKKFKKQQPVIEFPDEPMSAITTSTRPALTYIPPNTSAVTELLKDKIKKRIGEVKQSRRNKKFKKQQPMNEPVAPLFQDLLPDPNVDMEEVTPVRKSVRHIDLPPFYGTSVDKQQIKLPKFSTWLKYDRPGKKKLPRKKSTKLVKDNLNISYVVETSGLKRRKIAKKKKDQAQSEDESQDSFYGARIRKGGERKKSVQLRKNPEKKAISREVEIKRPSLRRPPSWLLSDDEEKAVSREVELRRPSLRPPSWLVSDDEDMVEEAPATRTRPLSSDDEEMPPLRRVQKRKLNISNKHIKKRK